MNKRIRKKRAKQRWAQVERMLDDLRAAGLFASFIEDVSEYVAGADLLSYFTTSATDPHLQADSPE